MGMFGRIGHGLITASVMCLVGMVAGADAQEAVVFNRDIKPILSENCFQCHGPDAAHREADLRLDTEAGVHGDLGGYAAFTPGDLDASEAYQLMLTADEADRMPPVDSGKELSAAQLDLIKRWIEQGAQWQGHWSFIEPAKAKLPAVKAKAWARNGVDRFVLSHLEKIGMTPSGQADRAAVLRRVSLDLTGLVPTLEELDAFVLDKKEGAYERAVDRLLASEAYGERMALNWLDAARYADTHGYHIDSGRDMWPWRDWVINAYNANMPFDQFTIEQLAGDLLKDATVSQKIASGFNRNHMINFEGGAIPEEYLAEYVIDRVKTTGTVWLGLTLGCAQCHDHKYDPISQEEFYRLYAFFNTVDEKGLDGRTGNAEPSVKAPRPVLEDELAKLNGQIAQLGEKMKTRQASKAFAADYEGWLNQMNDGRVFAGEQPGDAVIHLMLDEGKGTKMKGVGVQKGQAAGGVAWGDWRDGKAKALVFNGQSTVRVGYGADFEKDDKFSFSAWIYPTAKDGGAILSKMDDGPQQVGYDFVLEGMKPTVNLVSIWGKDQIRVRSKAEVAINKWTHVAAIYNGSGSAPGVSIFINGKKVASDIVKNSLHGSIRVQREVLIGRRNRNFGFVGMLRDVRIFDRTLEPIEAGLLAGVDPLKGVFNKPVAKRTAKEKTSLRDYYLAYRDKPYMKHLAASKTLKAEAKTLSARIPTSMVMREMAVPRETFILNRGQYDHPTGDALSPTTPASLPAMPTGVKADRLGLARWLVNGSHPLTARVAVNRYWQMLFGRGLVVTSDDFGAQGEWPSHPALLDWLAVTFVQEGWDVKKMMRRLVTSATYRQSANVSPKALKQDAENIWLARGARFRLQAELIRDNTLAISGLLERQVGGPSVLPYQPPGLWLAMGFGETRKSSWSAQEFIQGHGADLYRRGMYTFWKRSVPPPSMVAIDAPNREVCTVRRAVTNTPISALVLMNDVQFVEAARVLAERTMKFSKINRKRIGWVFRKATARQLEEAEAAVLQRVYKQHLIHYQANPSEAIRLIEAGEYARDETLDAAQHAAWTMVISMILNLDETVTKG